MTIYLIGVLVMAICMAIGTYKGTTPFPPNPTTKETIQVYTYCGLMLLSSWVGILFGIFYSYKTNNK